jgi:sulfoquinovose isomerase
MPDETPIGIAWQDRIFHRRFLRAQAEQLFASFAHRTLNPDGGFFGLDLAGAPVPIIRELHATTRLIYCFCLGEHLGIPGSRMMLDHGMSFLKTHHHDALHGGYFWSIGENGPENSAKKAYGHAFVLMAGAAAKSVGHKDADALLADAADIIETRFWEEAHGAVSEEASRDWSEKSTYRGQNANMHMTEALITAFEVTGNRTFLDKAERIADLIIGRHATRLDFRVAEHFHDDWTLDRSFSGDEIFRPEGTTPGHWLEWSRLLLQLWVAGGRQQDWMKHAARALFSQAVALGWDKTHGGFYYTLDWQNRPLRREKIWWPLTEAIGAAAFLNAHDPHPFHESCYRMFWTFASAHMIDRENGSWHPELDETLAPVQRLFTGKHDLYHTLQACLIPLFPANGSLVAMIGQASKA